MVEDAIAGVEADWKAGVKCIAVSTTRPWSALSKADVIVDSLGELAMSDFD
jgi:beta-phosphoglucomutase